MSSAHDNLSQRPAFFNTGPRRWCPHCKAQRSTYHSRFTVHFSADGTLCLGSDQPVQKQEDSHVEPRPE